MGRMKESKYIRADLFMNKIAGSAFFSAAEKGKIRAAIEKEPGEDVTPVVHAHWVYGYTFPDGQYRKCSACNELIKAVANDGNFCGHCGAKMDEGGIKMKLERMVEIETSDIEVGDRIHIAHYTATCQEITPKGALFLMDQYLDKPMVMNRNNSNQGGYEESDLRRALQSEDILKIFSCICEWMVPFDNGDLLRIPFFSEIFGQEDAEYFETDGCEQWELMKDRKNRNAFRQNCLEWGWLQNKRKGSAADFALVANRGYAICATALGSAGVRPAFLITTCRKTREEAEKCHS